MSRNMMHRLKYGYQIYQSPMKLAFRGHMSPLDEHKVRPIFVQDFSTLICESIFFTNIYEQLKLTGAPFHFGTQALQRLCTLVNTDITHLNQFTTTLDWSAFDANCPKWLLNVGFDILYQLIDFNKMEVYTDGYTIDFTDKKADQYR